MEIAPSVCLNILPSPPFCRVVEFVLQPAQSRPPSTATLNLSLVFSGLSYEYFCPWTMLSNSTHTTQLIPALLSAVWNMEPPKRSYLPHPTYDRYSPPRHCLSPTHRFVMVFISSLLWFLPPSTLHTSASISNSSFPSHVLNFIPRLYYGNRFRFVAPGLGGMRHRKYRDRECATDHL